MIKKLTDHDLPILCALAIFALVIAACGYAIIDSIRQELLHQDAREASASWATMAQSAILPDSGFQPGDAARRTPGLPGSADGNHERVFRYTLFDPDGRMIHDSDAGTDRTAGTGEARTNIPGEILEKIHTGASMVFTRQGGESARPAHYAETYVPVMADGRNYAIAGVYLDQTDKARQLANAFQAITGVSVILLGLAVFVPAGLLLRRSNENRSRERQIDFIARHDKVTGLVNRMEFLNRLADFLHDSKEQAYQYAVVCLGIDGMNTINNTLGHGVGDQALREIAARCGQLAPEGSLIGRLDGDEIAIAFRHSAPAEALHGLVASLRAGLCEPFEAGGKTVSLNVRAGIALHTHDELAAVDLLKHAHVAMSWAKSENAGMVRLFSQDMDTALTQRVEIELSLGCALERGEFEVHYQPQFDLGSGALRCVEALVRWRHPQMGLISPDRFIPLAERSGLIHELGAWILRQACMRAVTWPDHVHVAVNLSPVQFGSTALASLVLDILNDTGLAGDRLELEITEGLFLANVEGLYETLKRLRGAGVGIAMDDFGTGYSSLSYLSRFPFTKLKIDRSFINSMEDDRIAVSIVQAVIGLGHSLNMSVTAEGVETAMQAEALAGMGCELGQGYLFAKPMDGEALQKQFFAVDSPDKNKVLSHDAGGANGNAHQGKAPLRVVGAQA